MISNKAQIQPPMRPKDLSYKYVHCANENGICNVSVGSRSIAYAADDGSGKIHYRNTTGVSLACNNQTFGDPSPGSKKSCWIMEVPNDLSFSNGKPNNFSPCAEQNQTCNIEGINPADILYGANGKYFYANATTTDCNDNILGDPIPNVPKECYFRKSLLPSIGSASAATSLQGLHNIETTTPILNDTTSYRSKIGFWILIIFVIIMAIIIIAMITYILVKNN